MAGWTTFHDLLAHEIDQRVQEGCAVDPARWHARLGELDPADVARVAALYDELMTKVPPRDTPYVEPYDLETVRVARPNGVRRMAMALGERAVFDRIHGAWLGRAVGSTLGRPFMTSPFCGASDRTGREDVRAWLEGAEAWPLEDYVPGQSRAAMGGLELAAPACQRGRVRACEADATMNAPLIALHVLERGGLEFDTCDLALMWLGALPFDAFAAADAQVYAALTGDERFARRARDRETLKAIDWRQISTPYNPFREWAEAMHRAGFYGCAAPGAPELAAELAWRDARLSHRKNGVYAAMFLAAATAAAFAETDPYNVVDVGLSEIPARSRLAEALRETMRFCERTRDAEACLLDVERRCAGLPMAHAVRNACVVAAALIAGRGDFERTIVTAVCAGVAPAPNGAAAGMVAGVMRSARGIPQKWAQPLSNTLRSDVFQTPQSTISDAAHRTMRVYLAAAGKAETS